MFVGHLAVGLAAKRFAPKTSVGTLLVGAQLADMLWPILILAGVEHARIAPGITAAAGFDFYDYPISHSLLMDVLWAAIFAGIYYAARRYRRGAIAIFVAVISHWILDFVSHRPDMPLVPGSNAFYGLGLWYSIPATLLVEGSIFAAGLAIYLKATRARDRIGVYGFWPVVVLLLAVWISSIFGPPPPSMRAVGIAGIIGALLATAWAFWIDRHRISTTLTR
jgi:membrane-bound metal-dependent hydrolase YbcI (DUF457 family)